MLLDYVRLVNATKKFKLKDNFEFVSFDDVTLEDLGKEEIPEHLEIWACVKIFYDGEVPESYKALNLLIGDWVADHEEDLTEIIHEKLKEHIEEKYPKSVYDLDWGDSSIWLDQLDYMPRIDEETKSMEIEIELVLDVEPEEDEEDE